MVNSGTVLQVEVLAVMEISKTDGNPKRLEMVPTQSFQK